MDAQFVPEGAGLGGMADEVAAFGVAGGGERFPHLDQIQASFGSHDVSGAQAHLTGEAGAASKLLGAEAYATGESVAFADSPDLHTAAHEAAHLVQQAEGVSLPGGIGSANDPYERHADEVADQVVKGQSAEGLLDDCPKGSSSQGIQRKEDDGGPEPLGHDELAALGVAGLEPLALGPACEAALTSDSAPMADVAELQAALGAWHSAVATSMEDTREWLAENLGDFFANAGNAAALSWTDGIATTVISAALSEAGTLAIRSGAVAAGAAAGLYAGAGTGTAVMPAIGTAIGAVVGVVVGVASSLVVSRLFPPTSPEALVDQANRQGVNRGMEARRIAREAKDRGLAELAAQHAQLQALLPLVDAACATELLEVLANPPTLDSSDRSLYHRLMAEFAMENAASPTEPREDVNSVGWRRSTHALTEPENLPDRFGSSDPPTAPIRNRALFAYQTRAHLKRIGLSPEAAQPLIEGVESGQLDGRRVHTLEINAADDLPTFAEYVGARLDANRYFYDQWLYPPRYDVRQALLDGRPFQLRLWIKITSHNFRGEDRRPTSALAMESWSHFLQVGGQEFRFGDRP